MKIVGKVTVVLTVLMLLALVIGASVVAAADGPQDVQPPVVCGHGGAVIPVAGAGVKTGLSHVAPCSWLVRFAGTGRWKLEAGRGPIVVLKAYHYPLCKVTARGVVKGNATCAIVVKAAPETPEGQGYWFTLTEK